MGDISYGLWGEENNHVAALKKVDEAQRTAGAAMIFGPWQYPHFPSQWFWYNTYTLSSPVLVAGIQISKNNAFLMNSAYSVYKITFAPFWRSANNSDYVLFSWAGSIYYGAGTVFGKDMLKNTVPNTSATNSTYAIFDNQGDDRLNIYTVPSGSGKWGQVGVDGMDIIGEFRIFVWCDDEYATIRVPVV